VTRFIVKVPHIANLSKIKDAIQVGNVNEENYRKWLHGRAP